MLASSPVKKLVVPRVGALVIALPLLTILADIVGLFGGMMTSCPCTACSRSSTSKATCATVLTRSGTGASSQYRIHWMPKGLLWITHRDSQVGKIDFPFKASRCGDANVIELHSAVSI